MNESEYLLVKLSVLRIRDPGSEVDNPNHISEGLETIFWVKILKFFDVDPGFGINITDPLKTFVVFSFLIRLPIQSPAPELL
jgi:hypothetical protein